MDALRLMGEAFRLVRFTTLHDGVAFGATFAIAGDVYEDMWPMIEYAFSTFYATELE